MLKDYRSMSIAETLGDRGARAQVGLADVMDAEGAFAMATGFSLDHTEDAIEKAARRARWARRRGTRSLKAM